MTAPDALPCYTVTRESLMDALASHPLTEHLTPERRGRMADALLGMAGVPAVTGAGFYLEGVKAERERCADLASECRAFYSKPCGTRGHQHSSPAPFAPRIRETS